MPMYGVIEEDIVTNIIIAETIEIAQQVIPDTIIVDMSKEDPFAAIGWKYKDGKLIDPNPPKPQLEMPPA